MGKPAPRGNDQKAFVKAFNTICQWNSPWERWNDMVTLFSIEIANTVDAVHREKRNETYAAIARRYRPEEFRRFADLFAELTLALDRNPFQDFLGSMYMELELGSKAHGQCFTPYGVCQCMANMAMPEEHVKLQLEKSGWISVNDCACGAGATLIAAAERLFQIGINYQRQALFVAQDLDHAVAMMCYIQLSMIGCAGRVRIGDTLLDPDCGDILLGDGKSATWYTPMLYLSDIWRGRLTARFLDRMLSGSGPKAEQNEAKAYQEAEGASAFAQKAEQAPVLVEARKKGRKASEGQLMFDLTGG